LIKRYLYTKIFLIPLFFISKKGEGGFAHGFLSLLVILSLFLFNSCKKEPDAYPDQATIIFKVNDDLGMRVYGAKVYLFDNYQAYLNGVSNHTGFAIDSAISAPAGDTFKLTASKNYWVLVTYFDIVRSLKLSNVGSSSQLDKLTKGSVVNATIFIGPSNANVSFWSDNSNLFPIAVHFNGQIDSLYNPLTLAPTIPNDPNAINYNVTKGTYPYYAVGKNGCVWAGSLKLSNGTLTPVQFNGCTSGMVHFYTPQTSRPSIFPSTVVLDIFDNAGTVNGPMTTYSCTSGPSNNVVSISRPAGTYTYAIRTADNACTFTGSFTITPNSCQVVQLPTCP
jgi:hypothetical protein